MQVSWPACEVGWRLLSLRQPDFCFFNFCQCQTPSSLSHGDKKGEGWSRGHSEEKEEVLQCLKRKGAISMSFNLRLKLVTLGSIFKTSVPTPCHPLRKRAALKSMMLFAVKLWGGGQPGCGASGARSELRLGWNVPGPVRSDVLRDMVGGCLAVPGSSGLETHRPCLPLGPVISGPPPTSCLCLPHPPFLSIQQRASAFLGLAHRLHSAPTTCHPFCLTNLISILSLGLPSQKPC